MPDCHQQRRVAVYGLGGTIAMADDGAGGAVPALSTSQLVDAVPGLADAGVAIDVEDFRRLPSASLGFGDLTELASHIGQRLAVGDVDGVVVAQGTDTIEETAYLLDLFHTRAQPVVVTGAMRHPSLAGADGPANLLAAVRTAAYPASRDHGVLVVLADEIHAANRVRKTHTTSVAAFRSPDSGALGHLVEGTPRFLSAPLDRFTVGPPPTTAKPHPRVALATVCLGDDGSLLRNVQERAEGLVVAAFGVGHVPESMTETLTELADRIPVVLAPRIGAGPGLASTYGFTGSERDLLDRGLVRSGFLDPFKARLLLWALLAAERTRPAVSAAFAAAGGYDDA